MKDLACLVKQCRDQPVLLHMTAMTVVEGGNWSFHKGSSGSGGSPLIGAIGWYGYFDLHDF